MTKSELLQNAKPILFNTEMVRAILDGRKTVTRRVMKPQPPEDAKIKFCNGMEVAIDEKADLWNGRQCSYKPPFLPYRILTGRGDILYVRETFTQTQHKKYVYKSDCKDSDGHVWHSVLCDINCVKWRPSIHMPKEAARIFLRVTDVRVERLQDITEEQCDAEGFEAKCPYEHRLWVGSPYEDGYESMCWADGDCRNPEKWCDQSIPELFGKKLWDSTIKKSDLDKYGWETNPFCWVIEFERISK